MRRGVLQAKLLEDKYEAKQEFPGRGGRGCKRKNLPCMEYGTGYLLELLLAFSCNGYCIYNRYDLNTSGHFQPLGHPLAEAWLSFPYFSPLHSPLVVFSAV